MRPAAGFGPAAGFLGLGRAAYVFLALGGLAIAVYGAIGKGDLGNALFLGTSATAAAVVFLGIRRVRPVVRRGWLAIGTTLVLLTLANLLSVLARFGFPDLGMVAQGMFMAAYIPLIVAGFLFGRGTHRSDRTVVLDTGIISLAVFPVVWELVVEPHIATANSAAAVMALLVPVIDVLLVSVVAPVILLRSSRSMSAGFVVLAFVMMGIGDSAYAISSLNTTASTGSLMNLAWLASYVLLGTAALAPSARTLGAAQDVHPGSGDVARLVVVAAALLVLPLLTIRDTLNDLDPERLIFAVVALVLSALLILRLKRTISELAAVDRRFRRFMSHEGFRAAIKDAAGRYIYLNPPAAEARRETGVEWFRKTDRDLYSPDDAERRINRDAEIRRTGVTHVDTVVADERAWHTESFVMPGTAGDLGSLSVDITDRIAAEGAVHFQARLLEAVQDAVIVIDLERRVTYWNKGAEQILGFSAGEMQGRTMDLMLPGDGHLDTDAAAIRDGAIATDWQGVRRDGRPVWLNMRVTPLTDEHGTVTSYLGVANDVTARKEAELERARLGAAIGNASDGVVVTDGDDRILYVNPAFERMTGFGAGDVLGHTTEEVPDAAAFGHALAIAREADEHWRGDVLGRRRDGSDLVLETTISPIIADGQVAPGFVTILRDVTYARDAERVAERRTRERALVAETLASLRPGQTPEATAHAVCSQLIKLPEVAVGTVIAFGLDGIAMVLGQCIRDGIAEPGKYLNPERSAYLRNRAAAGPWVERWIDDPRQEYAALFATYGILANAYAPIVADGTPIGLLITGSDQDDAVDRMTERLPALLEFSAISGALLAGAMADRIVTASGLAGIHGIIDREQFAPVFQPIVELATGKVQGYEALTRFRDGTPPDVRFEEAHRLGAGLELEQATLMASIAAAEAFPAEAWLSLNVSPELILAGMVEATLPSGPRRIILEITEHKVITDYASFRAAMVPIRDRVQLAVDDAGAGFASLRHIVELAPAVVKIDRSLVVGIAEDDGRLAVVSGMVRFAEAAGLVLLAEGIETTAELEALQGLGVQLGQGYLLGRPAPVQHTVVEPAGRPLLPRVSPSSGAVRRPYTPKALPGLVPLPALLRLP